MTSKYRLLLPVLAVLFAQSACQLSHDAAAPQETATASPATASPTWAEPFPAGSATPAPEPSPAPGGLVRIVFPPGGTWTDVTGEGDPAAPLRYVFQAQAGQMLSVAPFENYGYTLEVIGQDGVQLTPPGQAQPFWRGILPATQDYIVTVSVPTPGPLTLRVAIAPPGTAEQTISLDVPGRPLTLAYPDRFAPVDPNQAYFANLKGLPILAFRLIDPAYYDGTNLSEAYYLLLAADQPEAAAGCTTTAANETPGGTVVRAGLTFATSTFVGAGAGNYYEQVIYRTALSGSCYEVVYMIHSTNAGNYVPGTVTEFDREGVLAELSRVELTPR